MPLHTICPFFVYRDGPRRDLHSFPTRRSSDLGVVLLDATTGKVWPTWTEIDQYTAEAGVIPSGTTSPVEQDLIIHRSEEHTSELQSRRDLVCRLLLEKKKKVARRI